jgi:hypothetical protein
MRILALLVVAAAGLCACTPMQWVKPDAAAEQVRSDEQACRQAAMREAQFHAYWAQQPMMPYVVGPGRVVWPYGAYADPYAHQLLQENRLAQFCMESKGYQLAPMPKQ